jgi:hypothetical protein
LSVSDSLLRFRFRKLVPSPVSVTGCTKRSSLPSIFSTRITSAPMSASSMPQAGPAM